MPRRIEYDDHLPSFLRREEFPVDCMLLRSRVVVRRSHHNNANCYPPRLVTRTDYYAIRFEDPSVSTPNMFVDSFCRRSSSSYQVMISEDIMSYAAFSLWIKARYRERFEWRFLEEYQCVVLLRDWIDGYSDQMSHDEVRAYYSGGFVVRHVRLSINGDDDADDEVEWINGDDYDDDEEVEEDVIPSPSVSHRQGLSDEDLSKHLKTKTTEKTYDREEEMICVVCQENLFEQEDDLIQKRIGVIKCGHEFHELCIREWLKEKNSCPLCKSIAVILAPA